MRLGEAQRRRRGEQALARAVRQRLASPRLWGTGCKHPGVHVGCCWVGFGAPPVTLGSASVAAGHGVCSP